MYADICRAAGAPEYPALGGQSAITRVDSGARNYHLHTVCQRRWGRHKGQPGDLTNTINGHGQNPLYPWREGRSPLILDIVHEYKSWARRPSKSVLYVCILRDARLRAGGHSTGTRRNFVAKAEWKHLEMCACWAEGGCVKISHLRFSISQSYCKLFPKGFSLL